jgi:hypothetical protein
MYYRIAMQVGPSPTLRRQSTTLASLNTLLQWLRCYQNIPRERLRVFSSASRADLDEQCLRESQGLAATSLPVTHFWPATSGASQTSTRQEVGPSSEESGKGVPATTFRLRAQLGGSWLDVRREELERGLGGDHDLPYRFRLPASPRERLAWVRLLARVRQGDLQADVAGHVGTQCGGSDAYATKPNLVLDLS